MTDDAVIQIYKCLCDRTRLRILNLLREGPLCVCHLQAILGEPQVKMSKHLGYMRRAGLVVAERKANWIFYRLPDQPHPLLHRNLACLQDAADGMPELSSDMKRRKQVLGRAKGIRQCAATARE